jgi:proliferating cell nuclear antigen
MLLKFNNPKIFTDVISMMSELVTEVRIKVNKEGLAIVAIDPANVALVSFKIPASSFSSLEVDEQEIIGVNLDNLKSVLKRFSVGILLLQTEENSLKVEIQEKIKRTFNLALINLDEEEKAVPSLDFKTNIDMSSFDFDSAIQDCSIVSESCSFISQENKFIIEAKGLNSAKAEFSSEEVKVVGLGKAKYSTEYLQKFAKSSRLTDRVSISFADDYPLQLKFFSPMFDLTFVLAPRVESED